MEEAESTMEETELWGLPRTETRVLENDADSADAADQIVQTDIGSHRQEEQ